ncbi:MAG: Na+/H+ antiporter NhaA [Candidatus Berkiella sp.]
MKANQPLLALHQFVSMESFSGILLMFSCALACLIANSPLKEYYHHFLSFQLSVGWQEFKLSKTILHWIDDGLMAIFFLLIGLELKREMVDGHLSSIRQVILPGIAAIGGVVAPVLIYVFFNYAHPENNAGWAIPAATDIAFALGVLSLLGNRIPISLKIFLLTLAIYDDLFAIIIIAIFYTQDLSTLSLGLATIAVALLILLNRFKVNKIWPYLITGIFLWIFVLKSGVHATLAGVVLGFCMPHAGKSKTNTPLVVLENRIHPWVMYAILPLFALANAGIDLSQVTMAFFTDPLFLGVMLGLFLGKQVGIFGFSFIALKLKLGKMPRHANFGLLYGVAILGGIGFTMSLFISGLAFPEVRETSRLGILLGSISSALLGYFVLRNLKKVN